HASAALSTTTSRRRDRRPGMTRMLLRGEPLHRSLELEPHRKLDRTRATDLVERAEAAALPPAPQRGAQHRRARPELRGTKIVDRTAEVRMVQDVEHVNSPLE